MPMPAAPRRARFSDARAPGFISTSTEPAQPYPPAASSPSSAPVAPKFQPAESSPSTQPDPPATTPKSFPVTNRAAARSPDRHPQSAYTEIANKTPAQSPQ